VHTSYHHWQAHQALQLQFLVLLCGYQCCRPVLQLCTSAILTDIRGAWCCAGDMSGGRWGPFWDRLVFSKVRERLGGRVKYMTTGNAVSAVVHCFGQSLAGPIKAYLALQLVTL
jgi:long-subunit acyl-CoA synthetase (AMP-forming)